MQTAESDQKKKSESLLWPTSKNTEETSREHPRNFTGLKHSVTQLKTQAINTHETGGKLNTAEYDQGKQQTGGKTRDNTWENVISKLKLNASKLNERRETLRDQTS